MWRSAAAVAVAAAIAGLVASGARAQETPPAPAEAEKKEAPVFRPLEGSIIINLPSVNVPAPGTLSLLFTHRFNEPVQDSNFNDLFSFDSGANIGIGVAYAPLKNLDVSFYRYSNLDKTYQFGAKYALRPEGPFGISLAAGGDVRTAPGLDHRSTFFAQAIFAYTIASRVRITAVPTYLNHTSLSDLYVYFFGADIGGVPTTFKVAPEPVYRNVFNVPLAASIALTPSISVHGEVVPNYRRTVLVSQTQPGCDPPCPGVATKSSPGVGWTVSVEKVLLRHRFAFMAGNMRETTTDQYAVPGFRGAPKNIYLGFNLSRQWKVN